MTLSEETGSFLTDDHASLGLIFLVAEGQTDLKFLELHIFTVLENWEFSVSGLQ